MYEVDDLLPAEIISWMVEQLRLFRMSSAHGSLELNIQDGYISTYGDCHRHKASGRTRYRTKSTKVN